MARETQGLAEVKGLPAIGPATLKGFAIAKVLAESLRRPGPRPRRDKLQATLENLHKLDIGGFDVSDAPTTTWTWTLLIYPSSETTAGSNANPRIQPD